MLGFPASEVSLQSLYTYVPAPLPFNPEARVTLDRLMADTFQLSLSTTLSVFTRDLILCQRQPTDGYTSPFLRTEMG